MSDVALETIYKIYLDLSKPAGLSDHVDDTDASEHEENMIVLQYFSDLFPFVDMPFETALRMFLSRVKLPLDAQRIELILREFAYSYHEKNEKIFSSVEVVTILAYAVIMLNSNVHNPEIEKHQVISEEKFVATNAGVDEGKDIPRPILHEIYHSVINHEIVSIHEPDGIFEQDGTQVFLFSEPFAEGQLRKQGGINRVWANRYFRICESRLFYFKNDKDHIEKGFFELENTQTRVSAAQRKIIETIPLGGRLVASARVVDRETRELQYGNHATIQLKANSEDEANAWAMYLNTAALRGGKLRAES